MRKSSITINLNDKLRHCKWYMSFDYWEDNCIIGILTEFSSEEIFWCAFDRKTDGF